MRQRFSYKMSNLVVIYNYFKFQPHRNLSAIKRKKIPDEPFILPRSHHIPLPEDRTRTALCIGNSMDGSIDEGASKNITGKKNRSFPRFDLFACFMLQLPHGRSAHIQTNNLTLFRDAPLLASYAEKTVESHPLLPSAAVRRRMPFHIFVYSFALRSCGLQHRVLAFSAVAPSHASSSSVSLIPVVYFQR